METAHQRDGHRETAGGEQEQEQLQVENSLAVGFRSDHVPIGRVSWVSS